MPYDMRRMFDADEKALHDAARTKDDQQEQQEDEREAENTGHHVGMLDSRSVDAFFKVTSSMTVALERSRDVQFDATLTRTERLAMNALYMAKNARDVHSDGGISGLKRAQLLNQALAYLQPLLSVGMRPDFKEGRLMYEHLVGQIKQARTEIKTAIKLENYIPAGVPDSKRREQDDDGDDGNDDGNDDGGDSDADTDVDAAADTET